jgi:hypothetical protein
MVRRIVLAAAVVAAIVLFSLSPAGRTVAEGVQSVYVTNFPGTFTVEGVVSLKGPIRSAQFVGRRDVTVPPVSAKDTQRWVEGGTLDPDGFTHMVLSMTGQIKGEVVRPGLVTAVLIPDEDSIVRAFEEKGQLQFAFEVSAKDVSSASPYFASDQPRFQLGFPRYRVYFYNTAEKAVTVNLYAYLTN